MAFLDLFYDDNRIEEAIRAFVGKGESKFTDRQLADMAGEGKDDLMAAEGYGNFGLSSFNTFYSRYINKQFENEREKIKEYRRMAQMPEVADCIEDSTNESTQDNVDGNCVTLDIVDDDLAKNENIQKVLYKEFNDLFYDKIQIHDKVWDFFRNYMIDGRVFYERIIRESKPKEGIINIKRLPAETMDYEYDPKTGKITVYYQYLGANIKKPKDRSEAETSKHIIVFEPDQIGFINFGLYGATKHQIFGYLEKAKVPYNQLKLLETSVIIYRIVRAPERLVFKIDTGQMPKDKAMKFVEKIKKKFMKKQTYDPSTGALTHEPEVLSILENFFLPQSGDGRGSDITTVGGDAKGFTELDDVYYFARKLYRSLKYPLSRVSAAQEHREADVIVGGSKATEISRDEIKWAKFLERQQDRFCKEFTDLFLLHLEFKGMKQQYSLDRTKIKIKMNDPSHYKAAQEQSFLEQRFNNYNNLNNNPEFSKTFLMKRYLGFTDDDITDNQKGFELDKTVLPQETENEY